LQFCGEIRANTTQYHRGTIAPDKAPVPNWPLFDRAKLINSLDLSAAIIGTYTIGDFECLSNEFKLLFPRPNDKSTSNRRHVPTLVLHGQRGFSLDKWSSAKAQQQHSHEMKDVSVSDDTDNVALNIRGGGHECQDVFNRAAVAEKVTIESRKMGAEKRSSLTFEGFQLKLPKTPKRLKKSKPKVTHDNIKNACEGSDPDKRVKSGGGPIAEVIVIDSDSEDDLMPRDNTTTMSTKVEQLTPSMSTEAQSLVNDLSQNCNQDCNHVEEKLSQVEHVKSNTSDNSPKIGWGAIKPVSVFAGEVFFTQVLPRWCPPSSKHKKKRTSSKEPAGTRETTQARKRAEKKVSAEYSDDEDGQNTRAELLQEEYKQHTTQPKNEDDPEMKTVRGVHHPKFFLLFERSGSLVVIVSTSNLTEQTSIEGSWVQRFEPKESSPRPTYIDRESDDIAKNVVDYGMPSDFGAVLTDFLKRQSDAAAGGMMPDVFLRRYVPGLSSGLPALADQYRFDDAQVHLVSTVPGDHVGGLPKGHQDAAYKPCVSYGPQRVSFILSRTLNESHIRCAKAAMATVSATSRRIRMESGMPWLPPSLVGSKERLLIQPTSIGSNWSQDDLELIVRLYLQPNWNLPLNHSNTKEDGVLDLMDLVWPSMEFFGAMKSDQLALWKNHPEEAACITKRGKYIPNKSNSHVFLSSLSFSNLERSIMSRMALFTRRPNTMPYTSSSLHFKSICRLLWPNTEETDSHKQSKEQGTGSREYLSWFMLTSACLSKGAQGQPTPYRDPASDSMSYSNFELGVLFCSRVLGDNKFDRLYVSDPDHLYKGGCQCGKGQRMYRAHQKCSSDNLLACVKKVHLPIPYKLRPKLYQEDPDSDYLSQTPFMHEIPDGSVCVGNMKLTPFGQQVACDAQRSTAPSTIS